MGRLLQFGDDVSGHTVKGNPVCPREDCHELLTLINTFAQGYYVCTAHGVVPLADVLSSPPPEIRTLDNLEEARQVADGDDEMSSLVRDLVNRIDMAAALHQPTKDNAFSLVRHVYCGCGAMESFIASDGYPAIGPAKYPCKTVRALMGEGLDAD